MAFHWRADDGWLGGSFVIFQGIWTGIAEKAYIFFIFKEGGLDPLSLPLDPPMSLFNYFARDWFCHFSLPLTLILSSCIGESLHLFFLQSK